MSNEQVTRYYEALRANYDALSKAMKDATDRGASLSAKLIEEIERGQREALSLGEQLANSPGNAAENYTAVIEATLAAQDRALQLAKDAYGQAEVAGASTSELFEQLFESSRTVGEATLELSRSWMSDNAWSDAWRQGFEAMTSAANAATAGAKSSEKASV